MADDIGKRPLHGSPACTCLFCWAEIERLRAAGDALIEAMDTGSWAQDVVPAIAAWNEARRG